MKGVLEEFARLTGVNLVVEGQANAVLETTPVLLGAGGEIPPDEVYAFVEGLLSFNNIVLALFKGGERPLMGVYMERNASYAPRLRIAEDQVAAFESHSALLVEVTLTLDSIDVHRLATSMRALLTNTSTQAILPAGEHGMIVRGSGRHVASAAALMLSANEAAKKTHSEGGVPRHGVDEAAEKRGRAH